MKDRPDPTGYDAAIRYLGGRINYERRAPVSYEARFFKLERMRRLLGRLGDPHLACRPIHIAGSKGKGSVATMIAAAITSAGYRTGLFTSPHFERLEERFRIDSQLCSPRDLAQLVRDVQPVVAELDAQANSPWEKPTFFEIVTAMGFLHFRRQRVGACVLETGLGGRLDATNICQPIISVITSISLDHTRQLGHTLAAIAEEKAGIIKPGVPVVTGVRQRQPLRVIEQACDRQQAPLWRLDQEFHIDDARTEASGTTILYRDADGSVPIRVALPGLHQAANAAVAVATLRLWQRQAREPGNHLAVPDWEAIVEGLGRASCPARVEILRTDPPVVLDAAHNEASVAALQQTLAACFGPRRWVVVFGTSSDKDAIAMLTKLARWADPIILTRYRSNPRGADPDILRKEALRRELIAPARVQVVDHPESAWHEACRAASSGQGLCVLGSFFLAAELRDVMVATVDPCLSGRAGWTRTPLE